MEEPAIMTKNPAARRYWRKVLERMEGLVILDDLDSDALGVYCVMMARYETQCRLLAQAAKELKTGQGRPGGRGGGRSQAGCRKRQDAEPGEKHPPVCGEAGPYPIRTGAAGPEAGPGGRRGQGGPGQ